MKKRLSSLLLAFLVCFAFAAAPTSAFASHLRGTSISWSPTGVAGQVQFTIQYSQRTSFGGCTPSCTVGGTLGVPFYYGDGVSGTVTTTITSVNSAEDYLSSTATFTHTYTGNSSSTFIAYFLNSARISTIVSGHDQYLRMETSVTPFASPINHSPVVSMPAIITVPLQNTTGFFISASDLDRDTLSYRLSTAAEMYNVSAFACAYQQPAGLSVNAKTGQVTWDTTQITKAGCGYAAPKAGDLWTVQFMVQDLTSTGTIKSKVPLDVILKFVSSTEAPPTITLSNPGPITVQAGTPISFTATGNDIAAGSVVTMNATGLPLGASSSNLNLALTPAVASVFTWTPTSAQGGSYVITYTATNDTLEQALASVTIYVQNLQPPVLSCSTALTAVYGSPVTVPVTVSDPQADALSLVWSVDGVSASTQSVAASNTTTAVSYQPTFTTVGAHSVSVKATDTDNQSASCSTTITVNPAPQTISFTGPTSATYGTPDIALTGSASSGLPVSYTATGACTIVAGAIHITGAGSCSVTASQAGNSNYSAATSVIDTFTVAQAPQVITFNPPTTAPVGGTPITLAATGGASGNPVTYTVTGPAKLVGNVLTLTGAGNVVVTANQAGNANYSAATAVVKTIVATLAPQTITFNPPAAVTYGNGPITLAATGGASGNPVTYTVSGPATLVGNVLTITGAGTVTVTANQAGSPGYQAATPVVKTITVSQAAQTITFTTPATASADSTMLLNGTGGASGNPVTYTVTGPATVSGNLLTITGAGTVTVTANQAGNANYSAAKPVTTTIKSTLTATVTLSAASTSFSYPTSTNLNACVTLTNKTAPTGTISFYDGTTLLTTQKVNGGGCYNWYIAPSLNAGTHTLTAFYNDANNSNVFSNSVIITVARGQTVAEVDCSGSIFPYGRDFSCDANPDSGPNSGYMTYTYDGGAPVVVQMNAAQHALFTIPKPAVGTHTVIITYPAQGNYGAFQLPIQTVVVSAAPVNVSLVPSSFYVKVGTPFSFTATLTSWSTSNPSSVGTVSFYDGSKLLGTSPVNAAGAASLAGIKLAVGYHSITATYSGTNQYATGSQTIQVQVGQ